MCYPVPKSLGGGYARKKEAWYVFIGCCIMSFTAGPMNTWPVLKLFSLSYLYYNGKELNYEDKGTSMPTVKLLTQLIADPLIAYLFKKWDPRVIVAIGYVLISLC